MVFPFFFFLLFLFCSTHCISFAAVSAHNRRVLHESFFPIDSPPPSQPPIPAPPAPPTPYPFQPSTPDNNNPFFPTYRSPPPPPPPPSPSSLVSFPANISDINLPNTSKSKHVSSKLIITAITCVLAAIIVLSIAICLHAKKRRRHFNDPKTQRSDNSNRLNHGSSKNDGNTNNSIPKLQQPSQTSSEFLYLGTIVNSHGGINSGSNPDTAPSSRKMASPELRPLPPLNGRNLSQNYRNTRNDDDFYSTEESVGYIESSFGAGSLSRRDFAAVEVNKFVGSSLSGSDSSSSSGSGSPNRSVSLSISPPVSVSPKRESCSRPKSPELIAVVTPPPPQRPPPPPPPFVHGPQVKVTANESPVLISPMEKNDQNVENHSIEKNEEKSEEILKPKLKTLHWDKVRASSDCEMVWDQLKSSSFKLNEEMIETLFVVKNPTLNTSATAKHLVVSSMSQENRVLDPKKSQNIAILLRALNGTTEEICEALLEGNAENIGTELLEILLKMAPSKEEERKLKEYKDDSPFKLGPAEKFLKAVLDIPFAFKRIDAMLYISNFDYEVDYLGNSFETLEAACEELRSSRMFLKLLEAVLKTGNRMNVGTNRGDAHAFKLDTLLKLVDVKGADGKTTLLHFVVQEIIKSEGARLSGGNQNHQQSTTNDDAKCKKLGLQVVSNISSELINVKKSAAMDSEVLHNDVLKLSKGIQNIAEVVRSIEAVGLEESSIKRFSESMNRFMKVAEEKILRLQAQETLAMSLVKEITEYVHGDSAREEAHPFRIFMVVKDFLMILDRVCKEVGTINERTIVSSAQKFPVPVNPNLQPVISGFRAKRLHSSSDEESSSP
ncbi:formin-like protein 1 [Nicotiana tomentosiformis]|uniref:formin-like protein 1 n=1 Tax=Nicotiana tomentosiformis TaxID=4098 RepID=UPI00051C295F